MNGGRFDFDDGGTYCGGWEEGKAHGHGVCTGPDGQGEYAGAWHYGFEVSGVYTWPSGSQYAGQWQNGKRHGLGVEQRGRWLYKGEWTQGYKGRYGRREALNSVAHYLGTWSSGLHDGYGTEVYADGGSYKGQWLRGMRHGYGIRTSATWSSATKQRSSGAAHSHAHASLSSLRSTYGSAVLDDETAAAMDTPNHTGRSHSRDRRTGGGEEPDSAARGGFVLKAHAEAQKRRRSLSERSLAMKRTILNNLRIRKQLSTGDIHQRVLSAGAASLRSSGSTLSCTSDEDSEPHRGRTEMQAAQEEPPLDPNTVEVYKGEWKNDMRSGYGICERTDGLKYAGEWMENKKHGYGVTYFKDGTKEEGRYKHNVLVNSTRRRGIMFVRSSKLRERVEIYAEHARRAADMAAQRVEIATSRTMTAQERSDAGIEAASRARDDADTSRIYAAQFDPSFKQPGVELMRRQRMGTPGGASSTGAGAGFFPQLMANHMFANHVSFDPVSSPPSVMMASSSFAEVPPPGMMMMASTTAQPQQQQPVPQQPRGWHHSRLHALAQQQGGDWTPTGGGGGGAHSPPQHSADSGFGGTAASSSQQQHHHRHALTQQQSTESAQSQLRMAMDSSQQPPVPTDINGNPQQPRPDTMPADGGPHGVASTSSAMLMSNSVPTGGVGQLQSDNALRRPHHPTGRGNIRTRGSPSTMSLTDDHWDQYLLKAARAGPNASLSPEQASLVEARLRRNRPSLIRQCEVLGASVVSGSGGAGGGEGDSPSNAGLGLNRRCTLATAARGGAGVPIHSVYGADDAVRHAAAATDEQAQQLLQAEGVGASGGERGSLPNLDELANQPLHMPREEAARLASQRRLETQRLQEEAELLRQNPLHYLNPLRYPELRNWLFRWRVPLLLVLGNIVLFYCFINLLNSPTKREEQQQRREHNEGLD